MAERTLKKSERSAAQILKAAVALFAKNGFHGATVDEIANRAKINKERLYAYFGSKGKLFEAALAAVYMESGECDKALLSLSESDLPGLTLKILAHYMDNYRRKPEFWRMIAWANMEYRKAPESIRGLKGESLNHIRELYGKGQIKGFFRKDIPFETYIYALWALTFFYNANRMTLETSLSDKMADPSFENALMSQLASIIERA